MKARQTIKAKRRTASKPARNRRLSGLSKDTEVARLARELAEAREQQTATSEVLRVISSSPGQLEPVFAAMLANATRLCEASYGVMWLREGDGFRSAALHGPLPPAYIERWHSGTLVHAHPDAPMMRVAQTRGPVQVPDMRESRAYLDGDPLPVSAVEVAGIRTMLSVPMFKDDDLVGTITIYRKEVRPFTEKQIALLTNFANQAVIAIENTRLLNELRESLQQQTATADVLKVISRSTFDLQTVLDTLVASAVRLCEAEKAFIYRFDGELLRMAATYNVSEPHRDFVARNPIRPGRHTVAARAALERRTVHIEDVHADPEYTYGVRDFAPHGSLLGVPMLRGDLLLGVIVLIMGQVQPFTDKQIELVTTFADQAVIAIENVRLFDEVQTRTRELSEALEQQTATAEVLRIISSSPGELEPVFETMLVNAVQICGAKFGVMSLREGDAFRVIATHGAPAAFVEQRRRDPLIRPTPGHNLGRMVRTKDVVHVPDISADPESAPILAKFGGAKALVNVPLLKDGVLIGSLVIFRQEAGPFNGKQIELVKNFAAQAVIAIENARLLNELRQRTNDLSEALDQQTATSEVLQVISRSPGELEPVFSAMLANATRICGAEFGLLYLDDGDLTRIAAVYNVPKALAATQNVPLRVHPESGHAEIRRTKQVVHIDDIRTMPPYLEGDPRLVALADLGGARTTLGVPMLKEDTLLGVIAIYRQDVRPFTKKQIELVASFAAQAVIAIENTRLLNELREALQQQTATADVLKVISHSTFDLQVVFDSMAESAVRLCEAERAYIFRFDGKVLRAVASFNAGPENQDWVYQNPIPLGRRSVSARAGLERRTVQVADIQADPEYSYVARDVDPIRTTLAVPMLKGDEMIGTITIYRLEVKPFAENQITLMETFADQAVIAIENARLFESLQTRTRELAQSLEDLQTAQDRLVQTQKLASLGQLTAGIAHEIKNPLNFVNNFSSLSTELLDELQDALKHGQFDNKTRSEIDELTETLRANLDKIAQHGKRADAIVKNMLLHSRDGSGEHRSVDINSIVEESLNLAYHGARAEKQGFTITLERSFDSAAGKADVFPQDIMRVLLNLISNGFYAATKRKEQLDSDGYEPTITAATRSLGDFVEIRIRDNGTGIPPEVKEKMFNPFFTTKPTGEGTGLGLSISHDIIVKQHAGSIEVDTQPGEYTEVRIVLPRIAT